MSAKSDKANELRRKRVQNFRDRANSNKIIKKSNSDSEVNNILSQDTVEELAADQLNT